MKYNKKSIFLFEIIIKPISSENCIYNAYNKQNEKLFFKRFTFIPFNQYAKQDSIKVK